MISRLLLALAVAALGFSAEVPKERDLCAPPPGAVAPTLPARIMTGQGMVHFPITTSSPEAQQFFDQGVAQMHSFWANEAERSFLQAAELDPTAAMPYWGIAMVAAGDYRPRFQLERDAPARPEPKKAPSGGPARAIAAAQKALQLSAVPGKATDLERLYIASVAARRQEADPDEAYIAGLRNILAKYPDQVEAGSYLALHLMRGFTTPDRQPRPGSMEAVEILRALVVKYPDHPGVHHYIIHGFEGSALAKDAWPSCRRYPELVTNIPHALHMPGHIYAQTGKWNEAARSFQDAATNEMSYMNADALYGKGHHGHNVQFLVATLCFQGNYEKALEQAKSLIAFGENPREAKEVDNPYAVYRQGWFAVLRTLVTFEKWNEILDGHSLPLYDKPREQAWRHWAIGLAHANTGSPDLAKKELRAMASALQELATKTGQPVPPVMGVARKELDGQIAASERKTGKALKLLASAGTMERELRYTEPPSYPRPVLNVLGQQALAAGKTEIARSAFESALDQFPENPRALAGLTELSRRKPAAGF